MLTLEHLSRVYGWRSALSDVSSSLAPGITGLVGENGAGKSTLLRICAGILSPTSGAVLLDGSPLRGREARARIALMPQQGHLPPRFTACEFVTYLTQMRGVTRGARARAMAALDLVQLGARMHDRLGALSGGMQRRVWLAQALAADADVLLLDEPSTGLDPRQRAIMVNVLAEIDPAKVVILSSHVVEDVASLARRLIVLADGRVSYDGVTPENFQTRDFLELIDGGEEQ